MSVRARSAKLWVAGMIVTASVGVGLAALPSPANGQATTAAAPTTPIQHVVVIFKENRSFDDYFGRLPGVDGATTAKKKDGTVVSLAETPDSVPRDPGHGPDAFRVAYDGGKMDGF